MRDIKNYEGLYAITRDGQVWSYKAKKFLKPWIEGGGYFMVKLYKDGKHKQFKIHRLVAEAYIPNPANLPFINHKDECKTNNNIENLEFCTPKYNSNYGTRGKRIAEKLSQKIYCFENKKIYNSYKEAAEELSLNRSCISLVCCGKRKTTGGYHFYRIQESD